MKRGIAWLLCTGLVFTAGCGSDSDDGSAGGGTGQPDAGEDVVQEAAPDAPVDVALDEGVDVTSEAGEDAAPDATEDAAPDATVDASTRPPGQCAQDSDCSGPTAECSMAAPGGICMGCGTDSDCGNPLEFECVAAGCRRLCVEDEDCPLGMECASTLRCKLISCSSGCPAPYVCGGNFCNRPECASTTPQCPTGMTCGQDDYCVEDGL